MSRPAEGSAGSKVSWKTSVRRGLRSRRSGLVLAAAGLCLMGIGIFRGEMSVVFDKAVRICMECIGIG